MCVNCSNDGKGPSMKFVIPISSLEKNKKWWQFWKKGSRKTGEESLQELMSNYEKDIKIDDTGNIVYDIKQNLDS